MYVSGLPHPLTAPRRREKICPADIGQALSPISVVIWWVEGSVSFPTHAGSVVWSFLQWPHRCYSWPIAATEGESRYGGSLKRPLEPFGITLSTVPIPYYGLKGRVPFRGAGRSQGGTFIQSGFKPTTDQRRCNVDARMGPVSHHGLPKRGAAANSVLLPLA